jgi:ribosome maturation factor RimP
MRQIEHEWLERVVAGLGFELVHLEWVPRNGLVRVYIDKPGGVTVDDCARVSEHLSRSMTVEGFEYERLEISSPGLDRPLARAKDFARFRGHKARIVLKVPVNGRKTVVGRLNSSGGDSVALVADDDTQFVFDLANVEKARLVPELGGGGR